MKIKQITSIATGGKTKVFGLGDDQELYLWNNTSGGWTVYKQLEAKIQDPKKQSISDQAKNAAEYAVGYKGLNVKQLTKAEGDKKTVKENSPTKFVMPKIN